MCMHVSCPAKLMFDEIQGGGPRGEDLLGKQGGLEGRRPSNVRVCKGVHHPSSRLPPGFNHFVLTKRSWCHSVEGTRIVEFLGFCVEYSSGLRHNLPHKAYVHYDEQSNKDALTMQTPRFYRTIISHLDKTRINTILLPRPRV